MTATLGRPSTHSTTEARSRTVMEHLERDVVVVGAGVTGLTAATRLAAAGKSVVVLEARERIGGRLWTDVVDGQMREIGGQWVSPEQTALLETLDELGLQTYSRYREGESLYITRDGELRRLPATSSRRESGPSPRSPGSSRFWTA
jgi:monoamine oxidase